MAEEIETMSSSSLSEDTPSQSQAPAPALSSFPAFSNGDFQMVPVMYPALVPGLQNQDHMNRGAGIYAVPVFSCMGPVAGLPSNTLIPLTYNFPTIRMGWEDFHRYIWYEVEALVKSLMVRHHEEEKRSWDVQFHRALNDWELDAVMAFTHILLTHIPSSEVGDRMSWKLRTNAMGNQCRLLLHCGEACWLWNFVCKSFGRRSPEAGVGGEEHGQGGQQQHQQQQPAPQRQVVVRRFQIAFQLDLLLILKLAAVIFLFNQDGSRQRLVVLVFFASLVYLYQTGALTPIVRWLSQGMQRAAAPPHPPRPAVRAENVAAARHGVENVAAAEGQPGAQIENQPANDGNRAVENENENLAEPGGVNGANHWWGIVKEIQMIVFGFITSLLPGFHNID
uniref:Transmembrane protein n=1 Tax=Quercus lobata TaxID=97700 RepID=A0A7N2KWA5_QUELO